jgi:hypothetical protein
VFAARFPWPPSDRTDFAREPVIGGFLWDIMGKHGRQWYRVVKLWAKAGCEQFFTVFAKVLEQAAATH